MSSIKKVALFTITAIVAITATSCTLIIQRRLSIAEAMQKNGADLLDIPCAIGEGTEHYCEMRAVVRGGGK